MSIIRRKMAGEAGRGEKFISKNPLGHRKLIFDAVCQLFPDEMRERTCHYSTRPYPTPDTIERIHAFKEDNLTYEADLTVSKVGQTYIVEGMVRNKISGNIDHVRGLMKTVPRKIRPSAEVRDRALHSLMSQVLETLSRLEAEVKYLNHVTRPMPPTIRPLSIEVAASPIRMPNLSWDTGMDVPPPADSSGNSAV